MGADVTTTTTSLHANTLPPTSTTLPKGTPLSTAAQDEIALLKSEDFIVQSFKNFKNQLDAKLRGTEPCTRQWVEERFGEVIRQITVEMRKNGSSVVESSDHVELFKHMRSHNYRCNMQINALDNETLSKLGITIPAGIVIDSAAVIGFCAKVGRPTSTVNLNTFNYSGLPVDPDRSVTVRPVTKLMSPLFEYHPSVGGYAPAPAIIPGLTTLTDKEGDEIVYFPEFIKNDTSVFKISEQDYMSIAIPHEGSHLLTRPLIERAHQQRRVFGLGNGQVANPHHLDEALGDLAGIRNGRFFYPTFLDRTGSTPDGYRMSKALMIATSRELLNDSNAKVFFAQIQKNRTALTAPGFYDKLDPTTKDNLDKILAAPATESVAAMRQHSSYLLMGEIMRQVPAIDSWARGVAKTIWEANLFSLVGQIK